MTERDAYVEKIKAKIDEWNAEIDRLEARSRGAEADARIRYEKQLAEFRRNRDEAEGQLKRAREAGEAAWGDLRKGFEDAWSEIARSMQSARERFD